MEGNRGEKAKGKKASSSCVYKMPKKIKTWASGEGSGSLCYALFFFLFFFLFLHFFFGSFELDATRGITNKGKEPRNEGD